MSLVTDIQNLVLPPGFGVEQEGDVTRVVKHPDELLAHSLSVRLTARGYADVKPFLQSFGDRRTSDALRWLLEHPDVRAVMRDRVSETTRRREVRRG